MSSRQTPPRVSVRNETARTLITVTLSLVIIAVVLLVAGHLLTAAFDALSGQMSTAGAR